MKKKNMVFTGIMLLVMLSLLTGCSIGTLTDGQELADQQEIASQDESSNFPFYPILFKRSVKLHHASFFYWSGAGSAGRAAKFEVKVDNWVGTKSVVLHYQSSNGSWQDLTLSNKGSYNNYSLFGFSSSNDYQLPSGSFQFCFKYTVNGTDYWDSNNGSNYTINGGSDSLVLPGDVYLAEASVTSYSIGWMNTNHSHMTALIYVKNKSYYKNVGLHYCETEDGVWKDAAATYKSFTSSGYEIWEVDFSTYTAYRSDGKKPVFKFAVFYKSQFPWINDWDNNNGKNYLISDDPSMVGELE